MKYSKNPVKDIIYQALQNSVTEHIVIHKIDNDNSIMEVDYEKITKSILKSLNENKYKIIKE